MLSEDFVRAVAALPVGEVLPALASAMTTSGAAILQAPPGAGKTSLVPLALLAAPWLRGQRIIMLQPRRLAARAAARRMAALLGEGVGATVGYRTRLDSRVGPETRIEVVTEGILLRRLQADAGLDGIGLVIFDEFHERSLDADLGLALTLDVQRYLRSDLRLLVMSATLDSAPLARLLGEAPVITSLGRSYPVALRYLERPPPERFVATVADTIRRVVAEEEGSLLAFLPGGAEIRRIERQLLAADLGPATTIAPLYGDLPQAAQDAALLPAAPGHRKIVLATSIAETSLTIEGIRIVIDGGLMRVPRFEPRSGMTRLETVRVSQASAEQRCGRAGRLAPGLCYRLWREIEQAQLPPHSRPEILEADLAPLVLTLSLWGAGDPASLSWLDPPPAAAFAEACALLRRLDALDTAGRVTGHGRAMAALGLHPRLANMMLRGKGQGLGWTACAVAALLTERDVLKPGPDGRGADLRLRVELLQRDDAAARTAAGSSLDRGGIERAGRAARLYARQLGLRGRDAISSDEVGRLVALAYPDRIGQRRAGSPGQFRLANGRGAALPPADPLAGEEFLAVADLDGDRRSARIFTAAPLSRATLETDFAAQIENSETIAWDQRASAVLARRQTRLDALVLHDEPLIHPPTEPVTAALLSGIRDLGLAVLPWRGPALSLRQRIEFIRRLEGESDAGWPDLSDEALLATLETWLAPFVEGITRRAQFDDIDLMAALTALLPPERRRRLDRLAPTHIAVPSGSRIGLDYGAGDVPILAVRLQELFGARGTPAVADGRMPVLLHLLSPAGRPIQVTRDLSGFWANSYPEVRRAMRGRYPRHPWPEDPATAAPTARAKRAAPR